MVLASILLAAELVILAVVLANVLLWPRPRPRPDDPRATRGATTVTVLIPARNEEHNLPACLDSVLSQGETLREVLVYDDRSEDRTAEVVRRRADGDPRLRLIPGQSLPDGWTGKSHACWQLADQVRAAEAPPDWLLFLDADARLAPGALATLVGEAEERNLTLLSAWPALPMCSFAEKLLMPLLHFFVLTLYPAFLAPHRRDPALGLAHGACILVHRPTYERLGGHALVAGELFEDTALARSWRERGEASLCLDGHHLVAVRMYRGFADIWKGFQKNFYPGFRREASFWAFWLLHALLFLAPFLLAPIFFFLPGAALPGHPKLATLLTAAALTVLAQRLLLALRFRHPWWSVALHPLAEATLLALGLASRRAYRRAGVHWKGRTYGVGSPQSPTSDTARPSALLALPPPPATAGSASLALRAPGELPRLRGGSAATIIGAGLGGLALAARLAARGWRVTLLEQAPTVGGKMNRWETHGYHFDTGPSLITLPHIFQDAFAAAGARLEDHVKLRRVHPHATYTWPDGTHLTYSTDLPQWLETLRRHSPPDVDGFLRFMALGARIYALSEATFLRATPFEPPDRAAWEALRGLLPRHLPLRHAWGAYHRSVAAHFESPYLRQLFNRYPTYVGSSPYLSPATLAVIPYLEYAFGAWYPDGGLYRIIQGLARVAEDLGVEIHTGTRATAIRTGGDGRARAVVIEAAGDRDELAADVVILNGDASRVAPLLRAGQLGTDPDAGSAPDPLPPKDRSLSGLVLLLALRRPLEDLAHHAVYFSADYEREFHQLIDQRRFPEDPTVYVSAPSRGDRSLVPPGGGEALFVMANAPANGGWGRGDDRDGGGAWTAEAVVEARRRIFQCLEAGGFPRLGPQDIVDSTVWTPDRFATAYDQPGGAIYGTSSHGWRRAFLRPTNRHRSPIRPGGVPNLYLVGGSTHPGGGTPTVLLSAKITARLIARHEEGGNRP